MIIMKKKNGLWVQLQSTSSSSTWWVGGDNGKFHGSEEPWNPVDQAAQLPPLLETNHMELQGPIQI